VTDDRYTAEEQRWLEVWDDKVRQVAEGGMSADDVMQWIWKKQVLNAISVTIQRIKRSERPGLDSRRRDNTWVTVSAERVSRKEDVSPLAQQTLAFVLERLTERGHEFDVDVMASSSGLVVSSVNVKGLRRYAGG
jgi:hypothetical protein